MNSTRLQSPWATKLPHYSLKQYQTRTLWNPRNAYIFIFHYYFTDVTKRKRQIENIKMMFKFLGTNVGSNSWEKALCYCLPLFSLKSHVVVLTDRHLNVENISLVLFCYQNALPLFLFEKRIPSQNRWVFDIFMWNNILNADVVRTKCRLMW